MSRRAARITVCVSTGVPGCCGAFVRCVFVSAADRKNDASTSTPSTPPSGHTKRGSGVRAISGSACACRRASTRSRCNACRGARSPALASSRSALSSTAPDCASSRRTAIRASTMRQARTSRSSRIAQATATAAARTAAEANRLARKTVATRLSGSQRSRSTIARRRRRACHWRNTACIVMSPACALPARARSGRGSR